MKILIWIANFSVDEEELQTACNFFYEKYANVKFIGYLSDKKLQFNLKNDELKLFPYEEVKDIEYDFIIVTGERIQFADILKKANHLGIDQNKLILSRSICVPGFDLERYFKLRKSNLTIFAPTCWGGIAYNLFGLPFLSPFINGAVPIYSWIHILMDPKKYLDGDLFFNRFERHPHEEFYPVFTIGGGGGQNFMPYTTLM